MMKSILGVAPLMLCAGIGYSQDSKPNIVFILTDDLGWKDLACYGNKHIETPNIDRLAERGILFTQAYAACPVSSPTRASIMTGKYPARLQLTNFIAGNRTDPASPVLPAEWKPLLLNSRKEDYSNRPLFWHYPHFSNQLGRPAGAVRVGDYKLVESYETGEVELYDLKNDISESEDLSKKMKQKTQELYKLLLQWRKSVNAQMPVPNPEYKRKKGSIGIIFFVTQSSTEETQSSTEHLPPNTPKRGLLNFR